MTDIRDLGSLRKRYAAQRLLVTLHGEETDLAAQALDVVDRALAAAAAAGVADVTVTASQVKGRDVVELRLRAIDRSIAIDFARRLELSALRGELEASGGNLLRASSRFAVFHLEMAFGRR